MNIFDQMPPALSCQLSLSNSRKLASRCSFFHHVSNSSLLKAISSLSPLVFVPAQVIVKQGLPLANIYFINRGCAAALM